MNTFHANVVYHFGYRYAPEFGYFVTTGTTDPLEFPRVALTGSHTGSPKSQGYLLNLSYWPVQNVLLALQYTGYTQFNGAGTNYDGFGRNASDNNTLYMLMRLVF